MKLIFTAVFLCLSASSGICVDDKFFKALAVVESNGNPKAVGDNSKSIGIYQISRPYFLDSQKYDKTLLKYKWSDCFNEKVSRLVVIAYMKRYNRAAVENLDYEALARCHNSGLAWKKKKNLTDKYWSKFQRFLK